MATADAEAFMDAIEELMQDTSHGSAAAADYRLADPVLSKSGQPLIQGELLIHSATSRGLVCRPRSLGDAGRAPGVMYVQSGKQDAKHVPTVCLHDPAKACSSRNIQCHL